MGLQLLLDIAFIEEMVSMSKRVEQSQKYVFVCNFTVTYKRLEGLCKIAWPQFANNKSCGVVQGVVVKTQKALKETHWCRSKKFVQKSYEKWIQPLGFPQTHCEFWLRNDTGKTCLWKNIFWSTLITKSRGGKFFEFLHCPFEGRADMNHEIQPEGPAGWC